MDPNTTCMYSAFRAVHQTSNALEWQLSGPESRGSLAPNLGLSCVLSGLEFIAAYFRESSQIYHPAMRHISQTALDGIKWKKISVVTCETVGTESADERSPMAVQEAFGDLSTQIRLLVPHLWIDDALSVGDTTMPVQALARLMHSVAIAEYMYKSDVYENFLARMMLSKSMDIMVAMPPSMHRRADNLAKAILAEASLDEGKDSGRMAS